MAKDINRVILTGRLTRDAELRQTKSGTSVMKVSIANNQSRKNASGQWEDEVHYFDIVIWGRTAEVLRQYLVKGKMIAVDGRLQQRRYQPPGEEKPRYTFEITADNIQLLSGGQSGGSTGSSFSQNRQNNSAAASPAEQVNDFPESNYPDSTLADDMGGPLPDDEIPF
jgi:single-strand DNA-binding protein